VIIPPLDEPLLIPQATRRGAHRRQKRGAIWPYLAVLIVVATFVVVTLSLIGVTP
jgi:uncharacterized membrane protein YidH (DUF202 family)